MSRLLKAQSAQLAGDDSAAESHFRAMLKMPETELVAVRGLLIQAGRRGDHDQALEFAERAHGLRPDAGWAQRALFDLQTAGSDWKGALSTLNSGARAGMYERERADHLRAVLETAYARSIEEAGNLKLALSHAEAALKNDRDWVPAILTEGRLQIAAGRERRAAKHLQEAWLRLRHPDLARAIYDMKPDENASDRLVRFERINASDMDHAETQLQLGRLALEADKATLARDYALAALDRAEVPDQRFHRLMVDAIERGGGEAEEAREWLMRLAEAPQGPRWQCHDCGQTSPDWEALCPACGHFDSLEWRQPEAQSDGLYLVEDRSDDGDAGEEPAAAEPSKAASG
jgi:HemY protein